jgi:hypothetical protein
MYKILYNFCLPNFINAETALLLLELDKSLASLKDRNQISTLQLIAEMPAAFESEFPMGIFERLIYCCMPTPTTLLDLTIPTYSCLNTMDIHIHIYMYII